MSTHDWRSFLPPEEQVGYKQAKFGAAESMGQRPALLVIDCTLSFMGRSGDLSLEEATAEFPTACGPVAWESLPRITALMDRFREREFPIVYSRSDLSVGSVMGGATKAGRTGGRDLEVVASGNVFPDEIEPRPDELVLEKPRASVFFDTPLATYLRTLEVDTVVACGTTTSGCVRASVVDAMSHGFLTFVVEDACFDRAPTPHRANLWDMHSKYASVVTTTQILEELSGQTVALGRTTGASSGGEEAPGRLRGR